MQRDGGVTVAHCSAAGLLALPRQRRAGGSHEMVRALRRESRARGVRVLLRLLFWRLLRHTIPGDVR
eukprot:549833-Rhodomonas_salina.1